MKRILLALYLLVLATLCLHTKDAPLPKYLELSNEQLRDLGFVINKHGVFFVTEIPEKDTYSFHCYRGYLNTKDDQGTVQIIDIMRDNLSTRLEKKENPTYFDSLPPLKVDYYFVKIIETDGDNIFTSDAGPVETIPILVRQKKYGFSIKEDIIVFMKYTEGLKVKLSYIEQHEDYITLLFDD